MCHRDVHFDCVLLVYPRGVTPGSIVNLCHAIILKTQEEVVKHPKNPHGLLLGKLTLTVLNFWKFTSYCSLKPLWSGMGEVVPARTSPTLHPSSPPTVHQLSRLALWELTKGCITQLPIKTSVTIWHANISHNKKVCRNPDKRFSETAKRAESLVGHFLCIYGEYSDWQMSLPDVTYIHGPYAIYTWAPSVAQCVAHRREPV